MSTEPPLKRQRTSLSPRPSSPLRVGGGCAAISSVEGDVDTAAVGRQGGQEEDDSGFFEGGISLRLSHGAAQFKPLPAVAAAIEQTTAAVVPPLTTTRREPDEFDSLLLDEDDDLFLFDLEDADESFAVAAAAADSFDQDALALPALPLPPLPALPQPQAQQQKKAGAFLRISLAKAREGAEDFTDDEASGWELDQDKVDKARRLFEGLEDEDEDDSPAAASVAGPSTSTSRPAAFGFSTASGSSISAPTSYFTSKAAELFSASPPVPTAAAFGFATAGGSRIAPPSAAATEKAAQAFAFASEPATVPAPVAAFGFATAGGGKIAPPSAAAANKAKGLFAGEDGDEAAIEDGDGDASFASAAGGGAGAAPAPAPVKASFGFMSAGGTRLAGPSAGALKRAEALFTGDGGPGSDEEVPAAASVAVGFTPLRARAGLGGMTSTPVRGGALPTPSLMAATAVPGGEGSPSFKALPLIRRTSSAKTGFKPPFGLKPHLTSTPQLKPSPAMRKLSFAMPGASPRGGSPQQKKFSTPFKGGKRPEGLTPLGLKGAAAAKVAGSGAGKKKEQKDAIFDLTSSKLLARVSMKEAGVRPQSFFFETLLSSGLPTDLLEMDSVLSPSYVFPRTFFGPGEALDELRQTVPGGKLGVGRKWVENHWGLIVWKLAGLVRSQPQLREERWNDREVVRQLKYRYEREVNRAQRSAIKRIQEHDSSPSSPLTLCVSQVLWGVDPAAAPLKPGEEPLLVIVALELTDGWYRIQATLDQALLGAVQRGKIVVGSKLSICGARLNGKGDGVDVLEGYATSTLAIPGNGSQLADWDAKLGFGRYPSICSMNSLTSTGGCVPLMELELEKVFPLGYVEGDREKAGGDPGPWNQEEEDEKQLAWERAREDELLRLRETGEKGMKGSNRLLELLQDAVMGGEVGKEVQNPFEMGADEALDKLEASSEPAKALRLLSTKLLKEIYDLASSRASDVRQRAGNDIEKQLERNVPRRTVRNFRVVRVKDAREGKLPNLRLADLTLWDAKNFSDGFLREGNTYLVSNLYPKGSWARNATTISLATRRETRWLATKKRPKVKVEEELAAKSEELAEKEEEEEENTAVADE